MKVNRTVTSKGTIILFPKFKLEKINKDKESK